MDSRVENEHEWHIVSRRVPASEALPELLRSLSVARVQILRFARRPSLRGSSISDEASVLTRRARDEYRARGFGFWDFLLTSLTEASDHTRRAVLAGSLAHDIHADRRWLELDEFAGSLTDGTFAGLQGRQIAALSSRVVRQDGETLHLPMLDFAITASSPNRRLALAALDALGVVGQLYESGRSFHFIGHALVGQPELLQMLARAQLLGPITDHRWIAHQILSNECSLRVSTDAESHDRHPSLVAYKPPTTL